MERTQGRDFSYIPTGHTMPLNRLSEHPYFGEDYRDGKATVALFRTEDGKLRAVWSYGDWSTYGCEKGHQYGFRHTQSCRVQILTFVTQIRTPARGCSDMPMGEWGEARAVQWTLK